MSQDRSEKRTISEIKEVIRKDTRALLTRKRLYMRRYSKKPQVRKYRTNWQRNKIGRSAPFTAVGYYDPKTNTVQFTLVRFGTKRTS